MRERYLKKISRIGIDPVFIIGKRFEPDCLPPVNQLIYFAIWFSRPAFTRKSNLKPSAVSRLTIKWGWASFATWKDMVANKFVVLAKVRHSQRMNDALIQIWIITEEDGPINRAHCLGCKAGLAESCSHSASVLFYFEA